VKLSSISCLKEFQVLGQVCECVQVVHVCEWWVYVRLECPKTNHTYLKQILKLW